VRISIVTIFPDYFSGPLSWGVVGRAIEAGVVEVDFHDIRTHGLGAHRQVDDTPYGGGAGLVMRVEPLARTLEPLSGSHRVLLSPAGTPLDQPTLDRFAGLDHLTLVCGRYEGVDERVAEHFVEEEVSLGDFVLAGGEAAALAVVEGVSRLVPGVVGNPASTEHESFRGGLLEEPVYTKPAVFGGWEVPEVLRSGDHGKIEEWRARQRRERTRRRRPDLWERFVEDGESDTLA
jgi:tRNA (guanine37-N1)-methyltransferase